MKNKPMFNGFYKEFQTVDYSCFWLGRDGFFWANEKAAELASGTIERIKRLLTNLAEVGIKDDVFKAVAEPSNAELLKGALQIQGVNVLPHPEGLFAYCQETEPLQTTTLSQSLRLPISDLFSSVQTMARRLEECQLNENDEVFFNRCLSSIQKKEYILLRLANNLESYSQLKEKTLHTKEVDLHSYVECLCRKAQRAFSNNRVPLKTELEEGLSVVKANPRFLGHALCNLLRNSLQYTREGNEVTVGLKVIKKHVILSVRDKGIGIQKAALPRVFEPYYSVQPHLDSTERPGLGLGLTLVHIAAQAMGGMVTVESTFGEGTSVHLALPKITQQDLRLDSQNIDYEEFFSNSQSPLYIQLSEFIPLPIL